MRLTESKLERELWLTYYASDSPGIGGRIRERYEDFVVIEISEEGLLASEVKSVEAEGNGEYIWAVIEKRGVDSITAARIIARKLGLHPRYVSIAGLKDTRAVAYQFICIKGAKLEDVLEISSPSVRVIYALRRPFSLRPGMLYGNQFVITIRKSRFRSEELQERVKEITCEIKQFGGCPNYFGHQRFGTIRPNTHRVGYFLLRGMYEEAFEEVVAKIYDTENGEAVRARKFFAETRDAEEALKIFPYTLHHERTLLRFISKHPGNYKEAFRALPVSIRRLYIGAYQAYLFNKSLSRRLARGLRIDRAYVGDLVALYAGPGLRRKPVRVLLVTEDNIDEVNRLMKRGYYELVLNVFGYRTRLAKGVQGEIEQEILEEEGLTLGMFRVKHMPEVGSKGDIRRAAMMPEKFSFRVIEDRVYMSFVLKKGMYATTLLREYMKPKDIIQAGF